MKPGTAFVLLAVSLQPDAVLATEQVLKIHLVTEMEE